MSEYDFYEGAEGAGDAPAGQSHAFDADHALTDHALTEPAYAEPAAYADPADTDPTFDLPDVDGAVEDHGAGDAAYAEDDLPEYGDLEHAATDGAFGADASWGAGLLDGLDFDFDNVDLTALDDANFDASYDLIGSAPDEGGWWEALASDHNHDAAYDVVSYDFGANPYVAG
jgi:hypothetical protein